MLFKAPSCDGVLNFEGCMQNMEQGQFCFITDDYYIIYDKERKLMRNKEMVDGKEHGRPCFYAFPDKKNPLILWCVPISSQTDKYMRIYNHKLEKQRKKGEIPAHKTGRIWRLKISEIDEWVRSGKSADINKGTD